MGRNKWIALAWLITGITALPAFASGGGNGGSHVSSQLVWYIGIPNAHLMNYWQYESACMEKRVEFLDRLTQATTGVGHPLTDLDVWVGLEQVYTPSGFEIECVAHLRSKTPQLAFRTTVSPTFKGNRQDFQEVLFPQCQAEAGHADELPTLIDRDPLVLTSGKTSLIFGSWFCYVSYLEIEKQP